MLTVVSITMVVPGGADLAAYLAARRQVCVHVRVGGAGPDGRDDLAEFTSRELLARRRPGHDVVGRDRPANGAGLRTLLGPGWTGVRHRAAEPDDNAAVHA